MPSPVLGCSICRPRADCSESLISCTIPSLLPPGALCLRSPALIPSRQTFSSAGSPESPLPPGPALCRHLPDSGLRGVSSFLRDKGKLFPLHSYGGARRGRLFLFGSHRRSLSLLPHLTTPRKSILFFQNGWWCTSFCGVVFTVLTLRIMWWCLLATPGPHHGIDLLM